MIENDDKRVLIKTFPGLPEGAGIYKLPDGTTRFYNCAPGTELLDSDLLPNFDGFYDVVDKDSGEIRFIESDPFYKTIKHALMSAGSTIDHIKTKDQRMDILSNEGYGRQITHLIQQKWLNRTPTNIHQAMSRAAILGNSEEFTRLEQKLERRRALGLRIVKNDE